MEVRAALYDGLWDASYALLLIGFLIGKILYAAILLQRRDSLSRVVGLFFALAAALTFSILLGEVGGPALPAPFGAWLYQAIQPLGRLLIGVWLWRTAASRV